MSETEQPTNWKGNCVTGLRFVQILAISLAAVGFIWGLGDFVNSLMPSNTVTPMSVLFMLYGLVASGMVEVPIRLMQRKK